jgi:AcrR family transcriptional regulator
MADALQSAEVSGVSVEYRDSSQDPRIRRTRDLLQQAFGTLLKQKEFEKISVQDITDLATVNRATFYAHYPDKFALLECKVASDFHALLAERKVVFDGTCTGALLNIVLGVCDFLAMTQGSPCQRQRQMVPHLETAIAVVVQRMILEGLKSHEDGNCISADLRAATVSWAILGAAKEWVRTPDRPTSDEIAGTVVEMVAPILHGTSH